jgi:hypothetical protein
MRWTRSLGTLLLSGGIGFTAVTGCSARGEATGLSFDPVSIAGNGVSGTLTFQSDWTQGYCANVAISNTGTAATTTWQVVIQLNQSSITSFWSATSAQSGTVLTVTPLAWNAAIAAGASTTFGFCANATGSNYHPTLTSVSATGSGASVDAGGAKDAASAADSAVADAAIAKDASAADAAAMEASVAKDAAGGADGSSSSSGGTCTISGSPSAGSGSLTWYYFGQGSATDPTTWMYETACGYQGTESNGADSDSVLNIPNPGYFAAIPGATSQDFNTVGQCGACVQISNGAKSLVATIIDECPINSNPACASAGHLDLSKDAFDQLGFPTGDPSGVTWSFVPCPISGDVEIRIKSGNPNQIYVENEILPIARITMNGSAATQLSYGAWQLPGNAAGATLTLTDIDGRSITVTVPGGASGSEGASSGAQFPACP